MFSLYKKELQSYYYSPFAYVIAAFSFVCKGSHSQCGNKEYKIKEMIIENVRE